MAAGKTGVGTTALAVMRGATGATATEVILDFLAGVVLEPINLLETRRGLGVAVSSRASVSSKADFSNSRGGSTANNGDAAGRPTSVNVQDAPQAQANSVNFRRLVSAVAARR